MNEGPSAWRITIIVPAAVAESFGEALSDFGDSVSIFGEDEDSVRHLMLHARNRPNPAEVTARLALISLLNGVAEPDIVLDKVPPTDWLAATYQAFPPLRIGRFHVRGSHVEGKPPAATFPLRIDAATAFGSGEHPTTEGCLKAIERLSRRIRVGNALDMGAGTGILAFAVARVWPAKVLAADIDRESVRVARINARVNGLARTVTAVRSDGYRNRRVRASAPYDLIVANILARPLQAMARDLKRHLKPGGRAVLAGLLARQERQVLAAHRRQGLALEARIPVRGWPTLVLKRRG